MFFSLKSIVNSRKTTNLINIARFKKIIPFFPIKTSCVSQVKSCSSSGLCELNLNLTDFVFVFRVMVLENGSIVEFDSPNTLLEQRGLFYDMTRNARVNRMPIN